MYESIESDTRSTTLALPRESSEKLFDEYLASLDTVRPSTDRSTETNLKKT